MSRFKFVCGCGKRLAAYDWMVGQVISCPKCSRTITVPTPFQAEEKLHEMIEAGYTPQRRKFGIPVDLIAMHRRKRFLIIFSLICLGIAVASAYYLFFVPWPW